MITDLECSECSDRRDSSRKSTERFATIKSLDPKKFALQTSDVNAKIDFDKRIGDFKSNTDDISTTFPYNQYSTSFLSGRSAAW